MCQGKEEGKGVPGRGRSLSRGLAVGWERSRQMEELLGREK